MLFSTVNSDYQATNDFSSTTSKSMANAFETGWQNKFIILFSLSASSEVTKFCAGISSADTEKQVAMKFWFT